MVCLKVGSSKKLLGANVMSSVLYNVDLILNVCWDITYKAFSGDGVKQYVRRYRYATTCILTEFWKQVLSVLSNCGTNCFCTILIS